MSDPYEITDDSVVTFHDLYRGEEEEGLVPVGRQDIASYVSLPEDALEIIDLLNSGLAVGEVRKLSEEKFGEEVEIAEFIKDMVDNEMVKSINGVEIPTQSKVQKGLFTSITQKHVGWMFSTYARIMYIGAAVFCLILFFVFPEYIPRPEHYFFHPWYSVAVLFIFFFNWVFIAFHELAHLCAAKSVGIEGSFSLSTRMVFIVVQTNVTNLWSVPREKRYMVYFAGMAWDTMVVFTCLVLILFTDYKVVGLPVVWYNFLKMVVFLKVWGIIWQFRFNLQTDIYYVFSTYSRCRNLLGDTKARIRNVLARVIKRIEKTDLSDLTENEKRAITFYTPFYIGGTLLIVVTFFLRDLPIVVLAVKKAITGLTAGYAADPAGFCDAVVLTLLSVFNYGLLGYLTLRPRWGSLRQRFKTWGRSH